MARCHTRFQHAFTVCCCDFKEVTMVGSNQRNYLENANTCSKCTLKTRVATRLRLSLEKVVRNESLCLMLTTYIHNKMSKSKIEIKNELMGKMKRKQFATLSKNILTLTVEELSIIIMQVNHGTICKMVCAENIQNTWNYQISLKTKNVQQNDLD